LIGLIIDGHFSRLIAAVSLLSSDRLSKHAVSPFDSAVLGQKKEVAGEGIEKGRMVSLHTAEHWPWSIGSIIDGHGSQSIAAVSSASSD